MAKERSLKWSGSNAAMAEHAQALAAHPVKAKPRKRKKKRLNWRKQLKRLKAGKGAPPAPPPPGFVRPIYREYITSAAWRAKRRLKLKSTRGKCERCGQRATQVHHKHYDTLGRERLADLESLCRPCHEREHEGLIQAQQHLASI